MGTISTNVQGGLIGEIAPLVKVQSVTTDGFGNITGLGAVVSVARRLGLAGTALLVKDAVTGETLPPTILDENGYLDNYDTGASRAIKFSSDSWVTEVGPYLTKEATIEVLGAASDAAAGLTAAIAAQARAEQAYNLAATALAAANGGGGGGGGPITIAGVTATTFTLAQIGARDVNVPINANDISGPTVAKTGLYNDLLQKPTVATLVNGKVPAGQLPPTGSLISPILQNPDGSYPARSTVSTDETRSVFYRQIYTAAEPSRGTDGSAAYAPNVTLGIPGDFLIVGGAL